MPFLAGPPLPAFPTPFPFSTKAVALVIFAPASPRRSEPGPESGKIIAAALEIDSENQIREIKFKFPDLGSGLDVVQRG